MITGSLGRRYAKALLSIGVDGKDYEKLGAELAQFATLVDGNAELRHFVANPLFPHEQRRNVIETIVKQLGFTLTMHNFLLLLSDKNRINALPEIARAYKELSDAEAGRVRATVTSAVPLTAEMQTRIKNVLETKSGKKVTLDSKVDPSLIGGVVTQLGDLVYDGSVKNQLEQMKQELLAE
jgi:F-type H+-transporting ATPase subunit delta